MRKYFQYIYIRLQWKIVLQQPMSSVAATAASGGVNLWSREFQLLQERKRLSTWGITSFELHKPSGKIVFPCFSDLYQCLDTGYNVSTNTNFEIQSEIECKNNKCKIIL